MDWDKFKISVGYIVLISSILYAVLITLLVLVFGTRVVENQPLWAFLTNIISTVLGWLIAKASTIIDHQFGSSKSSEMKTNAMFGQIRELEQLEQPSPPPCPSIEIPESPTAPPEPPPVPPVVPTTG